MRAAVYLRQSLDKTGEGVAVARQRDDCLTLCAAKGWTAVEYIDNDTSATNGKTRPAYARMLADIEAGTIGAVVAWDLDRLHRRPIQLEAFMSLADEHQIALATVSGDVDLSTAQGRLVARLKGSVAAHEAEHKSARQRRAMKQKAEQGRPHWRRAFGYLDYQPDPVTAPLVKQAYAALLAGASNVDIAAMFNDAEAFTLTGRPWTGPAVSAFLRNPRNAGLRSYKGDILGGGAWPALVDESTWRAVRTVLNGPARAPGRRTVRRHVLTGVLGCGACGGYLSGMWSSPARGRAKSIVYCCKGCRGVSVRAEHVEPLLYGIVAGRLAMGDAVDLLKAECHDEAQAEALRLESNGLRAELDNIGVERAEGLLTGRQAKIATDRLTDKLVAVEARQHDQDRRRVFDGLPLGRAEVAAAVESLSPDRFRAVLDVLMVVTIAPVGRSGRMFNPQRVQVSWR